MDSPLDYLFELRDRREQKGIWPWIPFVILGVLAVVVGYIADRFDNPDPVSLRNLLGIALGSFSAAVVLYPAVFRPLLRVMHDSAVLSSILKGQNHEEAAASGLYPQAMVDSIAIHSVKHFTKNSIVPVVALALPITHAMSLLVPEFLAGAAAPFLVEWLLLTVLLLGTLSYSLQTRNTIAPSGLPNLLANSLILIAPLAAFMHLLMIGSWSLQCFYSKSNEHPLQLSAVAIKAQLLLFGLWIVAILILRKCASFALRYRLNNVPSRSKVSGVRLKNRWVPVWSTHPIVVRERQRLQNQITAGLVGSLVWHFPTLICTCLVIAQPQVIAMARPEHYVIGLLSLGLVQFSRALWTSLPCIVQEIESRDLESTLSTKLTPLQYQFGWTQVILLPIAVDTLLSLAAILATAKDLGPALVVPASVCLSAPVLGVLMGLCASCASTRSSANQRLVFGLTAFLLMAWQGGLIEKQIAHMIRLQDDPGRWSLLACIWVGGSVFAWLTARQLGQGWQNLPAKQHN